MYILYGYKTTWDQYDPSRVLLSKDTILKGIILFRVAFINSDIEWSPHLNENIIETNSGAYTWTLYG